MQPSVAKDVGGAGRNRRKQPIAEAELAAERDGRGFLHEQRIGPAIDDPAIEPIAANHAAETSGGFEEANVDAATL